MSLCLSAKNLSLFVFTSWQRLASFFTRALWSGVVLGQRLSLAWRSLLKVWTGEESSEHEQQKKMSCNNYYLYV